MKREFALLVLSILFCGGVLAQQNPGDTQATREDVQKYLEVTHSKEMMTKVIDAMAAPMHQMMHQQYLKDKDKLPPDFEVRMNKIMDEMFKSFPWSEMLDAMVPVYQKHFTKNDINSFVAFYQTPAGQKLLNEMPQITAEAMQAMMPLLQKNMDSMKQRMAEEVTVMMKDSASKNENPSLQKNN